MYLYCRYKAFVTTALAFCFASAVSAQMVVPVGSGSIASVPPTYKAKTEPGGPGFNATAMLTRKIYADELPALSDGSLEIPGRPIPTNDWWTDIINNQFSGALWSYPAMLRTFDDGVQVNYPSYWADYGKEIKSRTSITVGSPKYTATAAIATNWHDWDVVFRMPSVKEDGEIVVTAAHGTPFTWFEFDRLAPQIRFSTAPVKFADKPGVLGFRLDGDYYGLYYPAGAGYEVKDGNLNFEVGTAWVVVALLRSEDDLDAFARYAVSIPRDTRVSWNYDEKNARVTTFLNVESENLRTPGTQAPSLLGFLPHVYKYALQGASMSFMDEQGFMTPRGTLKLAVSENGTYSYSYRFSGMLPAYAAPREGNDAEHGFRQEVLDRLMTDYVAKGSFGGDTYWGGKGLVQMAMNMSFAKESGNTAVYEESKRRLRDAFKEWLTYTPGENNYFFSYYPRWGAMLGFDVSYDSDAFNDHHFHYGYFTYAAALLCMEDKAFARDYGELLTMIAKDYANWDRNDRRFPFMRTLDIWCGHSWAGGLGDHGNDNGNGQESTSEAMQSWGGLYLLGVALGDNDMRDAGIWGWNTEARATREYWYDVDAPRPANEGGRKPWAGKNDRKGNYNYDEYPYAYNSNITGKGIGWWTWFGGDPLFMHGIQWMPISPALDYLSWDPDFVGWAFDDMIRGANSTFSHAWFESTVNTVNNEPIEPLAANDWGNVALAYYQRHDPAAAAAIFDEALERKMHIATSVSTSHISYFVIHNHLTYGEPDFSIHADIPTAQVCVKNGIATYMVYNPGESDRVVRFYDASGRVVKSVTAAPGRISAISADPVATSIETVSSEGMIIPTAASTTIKSRVLDQYGAGISGLGVETTLSSGAPAVFENGRLTVDADAEIGSKFDLLFTCGDVACTIAFTVNEKPQPMSARIENLPEMCERGTVIPVEFHYVDQYETDNVPSDTEWTYIDTAGRSGKFDTEVCFADAGLYTLTAASVQTGASASKQIFVTPPLPLVSLHADTYASSAENVGSLPPGATDGDLGIRWGSEHSDDQWLTLDLGENCYISRVAIVWEAAFAAKYDIQVAQDGCEMMDFTARYAGVDTPVRVPAETVWRTVVTERAPGAGEKVTTVNATGRYIRMRGLERGSAYGYSCYEMSVYGLGDSVADDAVIGIDFALPQVIDSGTEIELAPVAYTRGGDMRNDIAVVWSADKEAGFSGNLFTPLDHGIYTVTASIPDVGESKASVFVNDVERPASIALDADTYIAVCNEPVEIPFTVMNQYLAPYSRDAGNISVTVRNASGEVAPEAVYDAASTQFRSSEIGVYTIDFAGLAQCTVEVKALSEFNLALGKTATASSYKGDGGRASLAVDGNTDTRWESEWDDNQWLAVDLEDTYLVDRIHIVWEGAYARSYRLQSSIDGDDWYDFYQESDCKGGEESLTFPTVPARYIRICCDIRFLSAYGFSIKELRVFGISRLDPDASVAEPVISTLEYTTGNGSIAVESSATSETGALFLNIELQASDGQTVTTASCAIASGEKWSTEFDQLSSGSYKIILTATDAFGNETVRECDGIAVEYSIVGINLALGKRAWSSSQENDALAAGKVCDGDLGTRWGSKFEDNQWVIVDLGNSYSLDHINIYWDRPAYATHYDIFVSQTEDEGSFRKVASREGFSLSGVSVEDADDVIYLDGAMGRYVKIVGVERATGYGTSIRELEVFGRDIPTGIDTVETSGTGEVIWFTLQGVRVAHPSAGIYIRVAGGKAEKVLIR